MLRPPPLRSADSEIRLAMRAIGAEARVAARGGRQRAGEVKTRALLAGARGTTERQAESSPPTRASRYARERV